MFNKTLTDLLKALKGLVVMSGELEAMATSLFSNQVPDMWLGLGVRVTYRIDVCVTVYICIYVCVCV